eukprot:9152601-Pyramimonas_sp.AAC.1
MGQGRRPQRPEIPPSRPAPRSIQPYGGTRRTGAGPTHLLVNPQNLALTRAERRRDELTRKGEEAIGKELRISAPGAN